MSVSAGDTDSPSTHRRARVNQVDIARPPLVLEENGQILRIHLHQDVPMRYHFISQVDSRCIVSKPGEATHILLDLLPPHDQSSAFPTEEERGYIYHRGDRNVLCGYWAQECLRVGGVAETGFWDLSGWTAKAVSPGPSQFGPLPSSTSIEGPSQIKTIRRHYFQVPGAAAAAANARYAKAKQSGAGGSTTTYSSSNHGPRKRKRASLTPATGARSDGAASSASLVSETVQEETDWRRSLPARPSVELVTQRSTRNSTQSSIRTTSPALSHHSIASSSAPRTSVMFISNDEIPPERFTSKRRSFKGPKKILPKLAERSADEIQEIWNYFMREIHLHLGTPIPEDAKMGNVDTVKQWMLMRVHEMWCEARARYSRRNTDHMSIMLSTWKTAREFNLSPFALRKYYNDFQVRIGADSTPYLPVKSRPPRWPFHDRPPVNAEAGISWILDWEMNQPPTSEVKVEEEIQEVDGSIEHNQGADVASQEQ